MSTDTDINADHVEGYIAAVADALDEAGLRTDPYTFDPDEILGGAIVMPAAFDEDHGLGLVWDEITGWQIGYPAKRGIDCLTPIWIGLVPPPDQVVAAVKRTIDAGDLAAAYVEDAEIPAEWEDAATLARYAACDATPSHGDARCRLITGHDGQHRAALRIGGYLTWKDGRG